MDCDHCGETLEFTYHTELIRKYPERTTFQLNFCDKHCAKQSLGPKNIYDFKFYKNLVETYGREALRLRNKLRKRKRS